MKNITILLLGLLLAVSAPAALLAQQAGYAQTNLVANVAGVANHTDSQLSNPWGISFLPGNPFWIANNNGGTSTLYDAQGNKQALVVGIPSASVNPCSPGCPTGTVANSSSYFNGGAFIFDTEDGIIANWTGANNAVTVVDNSPNGAVYKGLALISNASGTFLLAANFRSGEVDVFDRTFSPAKLAGSFTDPNLPEGFAPHGIHVIGSQVYVAYAMQDAAKHDPTTGAGSGRVDVFDLNGNFVKTFASGGTLNAPWGVVETPASFGTFSNAILVGNFGDGIMNAFDPNTSKFLGQVSDTNNHPIINAGLWDMVFGAGGTGDPNTLYFTAGGSDQTQGLFATLTPAATNSNADFSLSVSAQSATLSAGQSTNITVGASVVGGFSSPISLTCTSPSGVACSLSPSTITPGSSTSSSTLTISAASTPPPTGYTVPMAAWLPLSGLGLIGMVLPKRRVLRKWKYGAVIGGLGLLLVCLVLTIGCGGGSTSSNQMNAAQNVSVMVTGQSGSLKHSQVITVTIN